MNSELWPWTPPRGSKRGPEGLWQRGGRRAALRVRWATTASRGCSGGGRTRRLWGVYKQPRGFSAGCSSAGRLATWKQHFLKQQWRLWKAQLNFPHSTVLMFRVKVFRVFPVRNWVWRIRSESSSGRERAICPLVVWTASTRSSTWTLHWERLRSRQTKGFEDWEERKKNASDGLQMEEQTERTSDLFWQLTFSK